MSDAVRVNDPTRGTYNNPTNGNVITLTIPTPRLRVLLSMDQRTVSLFVETDTSDELEH
ncbi:MAG: hypothetical protein ACLPY5_14165 [Candidatus Bathyarchaeia archaeon]